MVSLLVLWHVGYSVAWGACIKILLVVALILVVNMTGGGLRTGRWY